MTTTDAVLINYHSKLLTTARVRTDDGEWFVTRTRHSGYECNCDEAGVCAHIRAVQTTTGQQ